MSYIVDVDDEVDDVDYEEQYVATSYIAELSERLARDPSSIYGFSLKESSEFNPEEIIWEVQKYCWTDSLSTGDQFDDEAYSFHLEELVRTLSRDLYLVLRMNIQNTFLDYSIQIPEKLRSFSVIWLRKLILAYYFGDEIAPHLIYTGPIYSEYEIEHIVNVYSLVPEHVKAWLFPYVQKAISSYYKTENVL